MSSGGGASLLAPVRYPSDSLTPAERARLAPHVTDLDGPVFALVNLPETVKGALFARYSRYPGTLRRLFLEEFADSLPEGGTWDGSEGERAAALYERIFVGYGDDSVAQLGGAHVACEWVSNVLTKVLQRPRLAAYLEQSTRYIAYDAPMPGGGYRYYRDAELGPEYEAAMDALFDTYSAALPRVRAWVDETFPRADGENEAARRRAVNAKALDLLRGLLPASSLSHMGIYATGQAYEQLILHLIGHPLPEARRYGELILAAIKAVMPSFVSRVERPDRGGAWAGYLAERRAAGERWAARLGLAAADPADARPSVTLTHVDGDEEQLLSALLFEAAGTSEERIRATVEGLSDAERGELLADLVGERREPPPPPRPRVRGAPLPVRDRVRLRRVPRPAAAPHAHRAVAGADARPRRRDPRRGRGRGRGRRVPRGARALRRRVPPARRCRPRRRGAVRALPRLPDPLRARPQRARGDASRRAPLRSRGPSRATARSRTRCMRSSPSATRPSRPR